MYLRKTDSESEKFLKSTLNHQNNAQHFTMVMRNIPATDCEEFDHKISAALTEAIFSGLNQKVFQIIHYMH